MDILLLVACHKKHVISLVECMKNKKNFYQEGQNSVLKT